MWITVLIFAVAAIVGLTMALAVFQGRLPPIASAITHGALAATRLVLLIVAVCHGAVGPARWALGFFLVSVFFVWRSFHKMRIGTLQAEAASVGVDDLPAD